MKLNSYLIETTENDINLFQYIETNIEKHISYSEYITEEVSAIGYSEYTYSYSYNKYYYISEVMNNANKLIERISDKKKHNYI